MKLRFLSFFLVLILLLAACRTKPDPTPTPVLPSPQSSILSSATIAPTQTATPQPELARFNHYQFDVILDYAQHSLQVAQSIDYLNSSAFPLNEIMLLIPPKAFPAAYFQSSLTSDNINTITEDGIRTSITLKSPLSPGERLQLHLTYSLNLPQREGAFGYSNRQTNLSNWYPYIPPLDHNGVWLAHDPLVDANNMVVGEAWVNEIADFSLKLNLTGNQTNLQVATGAVPTPLENATAYELKQARAIAFSISNDFYYEELNHNGLLIQAYVFNNQRAKASAITQIAAQAMDLFSELFGSYPRDHIAIVSADFLHNMEMDGMVLLSNKIIDFYDDTALNNLTILIPHELSHQWFYSLVGNDQAQEPWLDEALATYTEALFYERYHPEYLQWWWDNRIYAHEHNGYVNNSIYQAGSYEAYRASVYLNGAIFIQELRDTVSDEAFFAGLKTYTSFNAYKIADRQAFLDALNPQDQVDIQPLFLKYFR